MAIESTVLDTEAAILNNIKELPESVKQSVLLYTEFLASRHGEEKKAGSEGEGKASSENDPTPKTTRFGSMKGTFVLPLPDDFDEPLECFEEYM